MGYKYYVEALFSGESAFNDVKKYSFDIPSSGSFTVSLNRDEQSTTQSALLVKSEYWFGDRCETFVTYNGGGSSLTSNFFEVEFNIDTSPNLPAGRYRLLYNKGGIWRTSSLNDIDLYIDADATYDSDLGNPCSTTDAFTIQERTASSGSTSSSMAIWAPDSTFRGFANSGAPDSDGLLQYMRRARTLNILTEVSIDVSNQITYSANTDYVGDEVITSLFVRTDALGDTCNGYTGATDSSGTFTYDTYYEVEISSDLNYYDVKPGTYRVFVDVTGGRTTSTTTKEITTVVPTNICP